MTDRIRCFVAAACCCFLADVLLGGCGIPEVAALDPPQFIATSDTDNEFTIRLTTNNNDPNFRGIEFYYRFYSKDATVFASNLETKSEVLAAGFRRIASTLDKPSQLLLPVVPVSQSDLPEPNEYSDITVTILEDVFHQTRIDATATPPGSCFETTNLSILRSVTNSTGDYKGFDDFTLGDADIAGIIAAVGDNQEVQIVLYAASYGKETFTTLYSPVLYLQNIRVSLDVQSP